MLVVFDWDGTLCDSTARIVQAMQQAAQEQGISVPGEQAVKNIIGLGLPEALAALFPQLDSRDWQAMRERYSRCYTELDAEPPQLFPGAMDVMLHLRECNHLLAVATGKSRRGLDRVLGSLGLDTWFDASRCADETSSKPDPHMLLELVEACRVDLQQTLVVGDSEYDLAMASAAGVDSVGVSYGVHAPERLRQHAPLAIIDELPQLLDFLDP